VANERALVVSYALRAYCLKHQDLPVDLNSLVPEVLPAIPADPYGTGILKFKPIEDYYRLYSVGEDGDDDAGMAYSVSANGQVDTTDGDLTWPLTAAAIGLEGAMTNSAAH
jgi:hypothetical protein